MKLNGKYAFITGASSSIGRAIAVALAKEGAFTALTARNKTKLKKKLESVKKVGGKGTIIPADLSNSYSLSALIETITIETEQVDILVNVAGIWHGKEEVYAGKDFETFSRNVVLNTLNVGIVTPTLLIHAFIPKIPKFGKIINISGTFENGAKGWLPYFISKRAIEDVTVGLAEELKDKQIQVNAISPSDTATEAYAKYFPQYMDEAIDPKEIAKFTTYLCSEKANNITGEVFVLKKDKKPYKGYHR